MTKFSCGIYSAFRQLNFYSKFRVNTSNVVVHFARNMSSSSKHKVFVYGTLKTGEPNHDWFSKDNGYYKFVCNAQTTKRYPLIIATQYNIPFLLYSPGTGNFVTGEVYEVDDKVMANLDMLEDHPSFYVREEHAVKNIDLAGDDNLLTVWIYFIKNFKPDLLKNKMFESYSCAGEHGLQYVTSEASTIEDLNF